MQSKAWQGVDRTGSGASEIFANMQKSTTAPDFPRATSLPAVGRPAGKPSTSFRRPSGRNNKADPRAGFADIATEKLLSDNFDFEVSEDALVALHLCLELTELLDFGNGDVLLVNLESEFCESCCNLG